MSSDVVTDNTKVSAKTSSVIAINTPLESSAWAANKFGCSGSSESVALIKSFNRSK